MPPSVTTENEVPVLPTLFSDEKTKPIDDTATKAKGDEDAKQQPRINPSRRRTPPPKLKKPVPHYRHLVRPAGPPESDEEAELNEDMALVREILDLFLNGQMVEAEQMLEPQPKRMYFQLARAIIQGLRALVTFHPEEIEKGMKAFEAAIKASDKQRKGSIVGVGTVKAVGSFVVGTIGAGSFRSMNRVQKHAELVYAESTILRSLLSLLYHIDFWMVFEECINLRHAFTIIQGLKSFMDATEQELRAGKPIERHRIDEHLVSGVTLSYSLYNIIISFMPDIIVKMLQFIGFPSDRDWGMSMLAACGDWDPTADVDDAAGRKERLASSSNDGLRRQFCDMVPIIFQFIVSSFIPLNHVDYHFAEVINQYNLERFPDSPLFGFFKGRHCQLETRLDDAVATYNSLVVQPEWHHLGHVAAFEELMCAMMTRDHDKACDKARLLLKGSRWSKCAFRYLVAITGYERGLASEKKKVDSVMAKVEDGMQKVAGMHLFFETFLARKSKRYLQEGGNLLLPSYDFMLLWNCFDMMPLQQLHHALDEISEQVQRLRKLLPAKMAERERREPLAAKDQTIEAATSGGGLLGGLLGGGGKQALLRDSVVPGYTNFYDDYCVAFFLQGIAAYHIAYFPEAEYNADKADLAITSFDTVFRYAPLMNDDTYTYYFAHYYKAKACMHQGNLDDAHARLKHLLSLSSTGLMGLPQLVGGKGRNSLELFVLMRTHSALIEIDTMRIARGEKSPLSSATNSIRSPSVLSFGTKHSKK
ncbi:hypothetical protein BGZ73_005485 [Actinomortierella ambigua]|nr:hypothetical protein BGZ73_005485 [Actinomortierella ambigua]